MAPGNLATSAQRTSPERRPPAPRDLCQGAQPQFPRGLSSWILTCSARMSVQHVVEPHRARLASQSNTSWDWSSPTTILQLRHNRHQGRALRGVLGEFRLGRVTSLRKPDGGIRGMVVSDIIRRLIARTIAQQISKQVEEATAPHQYELQTKSGCECVSHMVQMLTDLNPRQTAWTGPAHSTSCRGTPCCKGWATCPRACEFSHSSDCPTLPL